MNKNKLSIILSVLTFLLGILARELYHDISSGVSFNDELYHGEHVKAKKSFEYENFYNACKDITIIGLQAVDDDSLAWVLMADCPWSATHLFTAVVSQKELEKK